MERFDLSREKDRLAVAERVFRFPSEPHRRRHAPSGYVSYESYRDWLRDDFSYRCVFSLVRETWPQTQFHIDHLVAHKERPDLVCDYDNLILLEGRLNLVKGKRRVPDPCKVALGKCLLVRTDGDSCGEIEALNDVGEWIIRVLRLDSVDATRMRRQWLGILRSLARNDVALFLQFIGYPAHLPDLAMAKAPKNPASDAIAQSARSLRSANKLGAWY